jgi:hypothetical protein
VLICVVDCQTIYGSDYENDNAAKAKYYPNQKGEGLVITMGDTPGRVLKKNMPGWFRNRQGWGLRYGRSMESKVLEGREAGAVREWSPLELAEVKTPRRIGSIWRAKGATSRRRIKFDDRASCTHLMSRTVNGEFLFGPTEKEAFRRMMWRMSIFLGVEVLTQKHARLVLN